MKKLLLILMALISCYAIQCNAIKIVDGWTWKYNAWGNGDYYYFFDFKFDGTEEINGITYHIFRNTSAEKRLRISASGYRDCEIGLSEPWYVREEEGRFYVLFPHAGDQWDEEVEWNRWITPEDREVMLYDFNATTGDEYICGRDLEITLKANVEEMVYLPDEGGELKCQKILYESSYNDPENAIHNRSFPEVIVSEDFGILEHGFLTYFTPDVISGSINIDSGPSPYHSKLTLLSVEDEEGNEVYKSSFADFSSVEEAQEDGLASTSSIYDLHGREVSSPVSGSIYIRDGKKFVAR